MSEHEMNQEDVDAIVQAIEAEYAAAFSHKDARAFVALFSDRASVLTEWGQLVQGRAAIDTAFTGAMPKLPDDVQLEIVPLHSRALSDDVIVSHGAVHKRGGGGAADEELFYSRVYVWEDDMWRIASVQMAPASALPNPMA